MVVTQLYSFIAATGLFCHSGGERIVSQEEATSTNTLYQTSYKSEIISELQTALEDRT